VVGSVRLDAPELVAYVAELEASVERTPGVHLREGYVSDEMFDRWLVASDVVVLPYQHIWSSGVLERAGLFGRKVVATDVGGLSHQAAARSAEVTLVPNGPQVVTSLAAAMCSAAGLAARERAGGDEPWPVEEGRAGLQNAVAHRAAQRRGTPTRTRFDDRVLAPGGQPAPTAGSAVGVSGPTGSAPVRRLPPLMLPPARSTRVSADMAKRLVRRLTQWEIEPIVHQVNALREAVIASLEQRDR
jgi:hypothetical protein